jgi:hypothetical protein
MILFLNRNDEKWPHIRQIKIPAVEITFFHRWELQVVIYSYEMSFQIRL